MTGLPKHCFLVTAVAVLMSLNLAYGDDQRTLEATTADIEQEILDSIRQIRQKLDEFQILDADEQQPQDEPESTTGELTRPFVDAITMLGIRQDGSRYRASQPRLLMQTYDPERGSAGDRAQSAAIWAWGSGRPVALTVFWRWQSSSSWGHSFISTSAGKVTATYEGKTWQPDQPGLHFTVLENAPRPADSTDDRTPQMSELARRFTGYEMVRRRLLDLQVLPDALHRYQTEGVDGAIFALARNDSPYAFLFLEAVSDPLEPSYWQYAWAKGTSSPVTIELDGRELLHVPGSLNFLGSASDPFWVFFHQLPSE